jgi:hypothetical protein
VQINRLMFGRQKYASNTKMFGFMRGRVARRIALALTIATSVISLGAAPASAATYNETYACSDLGKSGTVHYYACDGTWWNANPNSRSLRITASVDRSDGDYRNTKPARFETLDGTKKVATWYCVYSNGTTSASKGSTQVGGGLPNYYVWNGWNPCPGYGEGIRVVVNGWYAGSAAQTTVIDINSTYSGYGRHSGHPETTI